MAWPPLQALSNTEYGITRCWAVNDLTVQISIVCSHMQPTHRDSLDNHFRAIGFCPVQIYICAFELTCCCELHHVPETVIEPIHLDLGMIVQQALLDAKIEASRTLWTEIWIPQKGWFWTERFSETWFLDT